MGETKGPFPWLLTLAYVAAVLLGAGTAVGIYVWLGGEWVAATIAMIALVGSFLWADRKDDGVG